MWGSAERCPLEIAEVDEIEEIERASETNMGATARAVLSKLDGDKLTAPGKNRLQVILTSNKFDKLAWDQPKDFRSQHLGNSRVHTDSSQQFESSNHPTPLFTHGVSGHNPGRLCSVLTLQQAQRFWALHYLEKKKKYRQVFESKDQDENLERKR